MSSHKNYFCTPLDRCYVVKRVVLDNILRLDSSETLSFLSLSQAIRSLFCENLLYKSGEMSEIVRFELAKFLPNSYYFKRQRHRAVFSSKINKKRVRTLGGRQVSLFNWMKRAFEA